MTLAVDHVIVCMPDLAAAVISFEADHGVTTVPGGRHDGHGTANRIVPLGDAYIELVAAIDPDEARDSGFGSWVASRSKEKGADAIAIRTDDLEEVCRRLDLEPLTMSRRLATGEELRWQIAGMEHLVNSGLPFFIQWDIDPELHPGRMPVTHGTGDRELGEVVVSGHETTLRRWMEGVPGLVIESGPPGVSFELADRVL